MMSEPKVYDSKPVLLELEPGTYWWCACGLSKTQPFCDGSHAGSEFEPLEFTVEQAGTKALCQCKKSGNPPYCDGSHSSL
jgi:CDGSH-type Zn-finger protein